MFGFFKRLFQIGSAESHALLDKMEDPTKMAKQGIRELKEQLDGALKSLAEVKAIAIKTSREVEADKTNADEYEKKAMALLKKAQAGQMAPAEAERLAAEALTRKEEIMKRYSLNLASKNKYDGMVTNLEGKIRELKSNIASWENEAKTLEARSKVSDATAKINKEMAQIDSSGTMAMLEKMKAKVDEKEALAEAYADMAGSEKSVDAEIDKALNDPTIKAADSLAELKRKMGISSGEEKIEIKDKQEVTIKIEVDKNNMQ
jgi:phage shock protein A